MAHVDEVSNELVIRIIYDGAPEAGKTTNIQQLAANISLQRRGALASPGSSGRQTEYFDWLDFSGGFIDGKRVRCQLVSVPGQTTLHYRRRYLLDTADAVVYVTDSRPEQVELVSANLKQAYASILKAPQELPVGMVVQANKQDLADAMPPEEVRAKLELDPSVPIVSANADAGLGVMQTFIVAVRLATDRVRALVSETGLPLQHETPSQLHQAMLSLIPTERPAPLGRDASDEGSDRNTLDFVNRLGPNLELFAGHVWPPVKGRGLLAAVDLEAARSSRRAVPWAPPDPVELRTQGGWLLHSTPDWVFTDESQARNRLLDVVQKQVRRSELLPNSRVIFLSREDDRWRLWCVTKFLPTLREVAEQALAANDTKRFEYLTHLTAGLCEQLARLDPDNGARIPLGVDGVVVEGEKLFIVSLEVSDDPKLSPRTNPFEQLKTLAGPAPSPQTL